MLLLNAINSDAYPFFAKVWRNSKRQVSTGTSPQFSSVLKAKNNKEKVYGKVEKCRHLLPVFISITISLHRILILLLHGFTTELLLHFLRRLVNDASAMVPSSLYIDNARRQLVHKRLILSGVLNVALGAFGFSVRSDACQTLEYLEAAWAPILPISMKR